MSSASSRAPVRARATTRAPGTIPSVRQRRWKPRAPRRRAADVLRAAAVAQERVLGADARVVEAGRDRVGVDDLAVRVREQRGARAVEHARRPEPSDAAPAASTPISRTPSSARNRRTSRSRSIRRRRTRSTASGSRCSRRGTARAPRGRSRAAARARLRVRRRADAGADQVVGRLDVRDPVADRLARRLLQRARAELDRPDLGSEQAHPLDVRAPGGACPRCPCRRCTRARSARRRSRSRRRAAPRRSRR